MATRETVDALVNLVVEITKRDVNDLVKDSKWGEYNFDDCRDDLEAAFAVVRPLPELPLESILDSIAVGFNAQLSNLSAAINNLTEFTVKQDAPEQNRGRVGQRAELPSSSDMEFDSAVDWILVLSGWRCI